MSGDVPPTSLRPSTLSLSLGMESEVKSHHVDAMALGEL